MDGHGGSNHAVWTLNADPRWVVQHCGHPTANYPWTGHRPDGSAVKVPRAGSGLLVGCFAYLRECQEATELAWRATTPPREVRDARGNVVGLVVLR